MLASQVYQNTIFKNDTVFITIDINMITILKTGYEKIMKLFYSDKSNQFHFREIVRKTHLGEPSAYRVLKNLEKSNILQSKREGNLKKYSIRHTKQAYYIFEAFDLERFEALPEIRKNALTIFIESLSVKPVFIVLFGSSAKGTFTDESDLDILLVTNKRISSEDAEKEVDAQTALKVSTFQITFKDFLREIKMKEDQVVQSALNTGFPILNHIYYYEVVVDERI